MRVHVLSDLHIEFNSFEYSAPAGEVDVIVLGGDIGLGNGGLKWIARSCPPSIPIVYVLGNHEYWGFDRFAAIAALQREAADMRDNIFVLEDEAVSIQGVTFLGATLWSDFDLFRTPKLSMSIANEECPDFMLIRSGVDCFSAEQARTVHLNSLVWLKTQCCARRGERTVVVTHHPPVREALHPQYDQSPLSPCFVSDRSDVVRDSGASLWVCGHAHQALDTRIGATRVVSNPAGYSSFSPVPNFRPHLVVEV
jgi:Icc-related predicted phosphoesterase